MWWQHFKYSTYLVGYTYILGWIAMTNLRITQELLYWDKLYALITFELAVLIYPIWLIGVIGIIKEWRSLTKQVTLGTISKSDTKYFEQENKFIRYDQTGRRL